MEEIKAWARYWLQTNAIQCVESDFFIDSTRKKRYSKIVFWKRKLLLGDGVQVSTKLA